MAGAEAPSVKLYDPSFNNPFERVNVPFTIWSLPNKIPPTLLLIVKLLNVVELDPPIVLPEPFIVITPVPKVSAPPLLVQLPDNVVAAVPGAKFPDVKVKSFVRVKVVKLPPTLND